MNIVNKKMTLPNGKEVSIETGKLAKQADGSVVVRMGDTMLLATVVSNKDAKDDVDFLPLTIDYREKFASNGRFPGGFLKREARPSDEEILTMRLVDRAMRPLFPDDYHADTQVMIQLMSSDGEDQPDALACLAASAAVAVSDIPFNGPVSEVRVIRKDGEFIVNPTFDEMEGNDLDMIVAGTDDSINMVEGEMGEVSEAVMLEAIKAAHVVIKEQIKLQLEVAAQVEKANPKREYTHEVHDEELKAKIYDFAYQRCYDIAKQGLADKKKRGELFGAVKEEFVATLSEEEVSEKGFLISQYFKATQKAGVRRAMLDTKIRLDGRKLDEIRPIWCEVDYLPGQVHGSAIFTRGETQSLTTLTLGSSLDAQRKDGALIQREDNFVLHYNFPPFSTGEARPIRGVSRREVGHGNLALRALKNMIPGKPENPYTVRLVSEILESNGSSSMATVCAGTLALLDGGVQMKKPVSGIAMGLISDADTKEFIVLSDILGDEDHLGDMDFKVTGTRDGITACQMDIKIEGLDYSLLEQALEQARKGRLHILDKIEETIAAPREDYKGHVPRIETIEVPGDAIGGIIGKGGETIQALQAETGTTISIDELENGNGIVEIFADNKAGMEEAKRQINLIAYPPVAEVGETYMGKVKNIVAFGAFCEIVPGTDGLLHVSEIAWERVDKVEDYLKEGQEIEIKVIGKDPKSGKYKISRKALLPKPERKPKPEKAEESK
ncbi:polyribonucleotide nucleotidyltransferase [Parvicella tangerina]|uniref:Polyribonucleotide nucleotidyltransferase n=1 Tax=Parvicella tangerina TaxID=2829795 RepID=A0A916JQA4_9FLAO|nr:polyribonucleotide nucleotidyltransferase [Parvicella tangerina]CAG5084420.1 Polyribonucleotide nucleotidyltransferase [Parvicella tangerina]